MRFKAHNYFLILASNDIKIKNFKFPRTRFLQKFHTSRNLLNFSEVSSIMNLIQIMNLNLVSGSKYHRLFRSIPENAHELRADALRNCISQQCKS